MKKIISILLSVAFIFSTLTFVSIPAGAETDGYLTYTVSDGEATIAGCDSSISGDITIPSTLGGYPVTKIGDRAFSDCHLFTSVTIPNSVTSIGDRAFAFCLSLTSITIPDSVISIGRLMFLNCSSLTSVTIPNSVTSIGYSAFGECKSLTSITVDVNNSNYSSVDGVLFNKDKTELIKYPIGKTTTSYTIPDGVTSIGGNAFAYCSSLTSVTIPNSVISIGFEAFAFCLSLTSITIPDSVTNLGWGAFFYCRNLTSVTISNSVTSIDDRTFVNCSSLKSVTIPDSVISIGFEAFGDCNSLTSVCIGDSVTTIDEGSFDGCSSLTSITIPNSVTTIGNHAFSSCISLKDIYIINNNCDIYSGTYTFPDNATIYGYTGSTAETYATEYNRKFIALDKAITTEQTASIRLDTEVQGIRFYTQIDTEGLDIAEVGTLIGPTDLIGEELTLDTEAQGNAIKVVFDLSKGLYDNKYVVGTIAGIKEKNYARDFTARAYIILTNGVTIYSDTTSTRNIAQIADAYIADANSGYAELAPDLKSKVDEWAAANDIKPEPTTKHDPYVSDTW
ncbi:MAG: leucine-rich repeat domain-containing protein [Clostridia bacterium]|nr:leucine-rich repeat domain-containing protein [Clostridia bacterium]